MFPAPQGSGTGFASTTEKPLEEAGIFEPLRLLLTVVGLAGKLMGKNTAKNVDKFSALSLIIQWSILFLFYILLKICVFQNPIHLKT